MVVAPLEGGTTRVTHWRPHHEGVNQQEAGARAKPGTPLWATGESTRKVLECLKKNKESCFVAVWGERWSTARHAVAFAAILSLLLSFSFFFSFFFPSPLPPPRSPSDMMRRAEMWPARSFSDGGWGWAALGRGDGEE